MQTCASNDGESLEMVKNTYLNNLHDIISTDIDSMHMDPEVWFQHHTLDSDAHRLSRHMIDIVQKYIRGDATRMESYIKISALVWEHKHCKGFFCAGQAYLWMQLDPCTLIVMYFQTKFV
jgi:hypothetical protein